MSTITIVAKLTARKEHVEALKAELLKMVAPTLQEEGCIVYRLHQDINDPTIFIFYENWKNSTCLEQHLKSRHYLAYVSAAGELIADKLVHKMTEIGKEA